MSHLAPVLALPMTTHYTIGEFVRPLPSVLTRLLFAIVLCVVFNFARSPELSLAAGSGYFSLTRLGLAGAGSRVGSATA